MLSGSPVSKKQMHYPSAIVIDRKHAVNSNLVRVPRYFGHRMSCFWELAEAQG